MIRALNRLFASAAALLALCPLAPGGAAPTAASLPDPRTTPGAVNPAVTQETIGATICQFGWTRTQRPDWHVTSALKRQQMRALGYTLPASAFEEDHLIPFSLGGSSDPRNLWPEPREGFAPDGWSAERKDELEAVLPRLVCAGKLPLAVARQAIASDWIAAWDKYVGEGE